MPCAYMLLDGAWLWFHPGGIISHHGTSLTWTALNLNLSTFSFRWERVLHRKWVFSGFRIPGRPLKAVDIDWLQLIGTRQKQLQETYAEKLCILMVARDAVLDWWEFGVQHIIYSSRSWRYTLLFLFSFFSSYEGRQHGQLFLSRSSVYLRDRVGIESWLLGMKTNQVNLSREGNWQMERVDQKPVKYRRSRKISSLTQMKL